MNINSAIGEIICSQKVPFTSINIRVECPLPSGVRVICSISTNNGNLCITPICGCRPFFLFVKTQKSTAVRDFNIVEFEIQPDGSWHTKYLYNAELQKKAIEMTR